MFNEPSSRRVNLAGRSASSLQSTSRSALLEQSRRQREQRSELKEQHTAALRLQAFVRATQQRRKVRAQQRALFDAELQNTLQAYKQALATSSSPSTTAAAVPPSPLLPALVLCVRRFLLFHSPHQAEDRSRWQLLQQLLSLSLHAPQLQPLRPGASGLSSSLHYGSLLLLSPDLRSAWVHQVSRLTGLLLRDIGQCELVASESIQSSVFLLFQLTSAQQWSVFPTARTAHSPPFAQLLPSSSLAALQSSVTTAQLIALTRWVVAQPPPSIPRHSASAASSSSPPQPHQPSPASPSVSWHSALRARLLQLAVMEEGSATALTLSPSSSSAPSPSVTTAAKNLIGLLGLLLPLPLQLALSSSATSPRSLPPAFAASYTLHVLSIPLLSARLSSVGLSAVVTQVVDPALVMAALASCTPHRAQNTVGAAPIAATSSPPSSTGLYQLLSHEPAVPSFTAWDCSSHPLPPTSSTQRWAEVDGEEQPRHEDDDEDGDEAMGVAGAREVAASSSPSALWLLGNLLDWHAQLLPDKEDPHHRLSLFLRVLEQLVVLVPARAFPGGRSQLRSRTAGTAEAA